MRLSLRSKLSLAVCAILTLVGIVAVSYVNVAFQGRLLSRFESDLTHQAQVVRNALRLPPPLPSLDRFVDDLGKGNPTRITVVNLDGVVLADTARSGPALRALEDHSARPEIRQALREGHGMSLRPSPSLGIEMMYVAIPWNEGERVRGTIRTALPLRSVNAVLGRVRRTLLVATTGAIALTLLITWAGSRLLLRALLNLIAAARRIASGEKAEGLMTGRKDELGELARALQGVMEEMADRVNLLSRERNQLEAILNGLREGVLVVNHEAKVILANASAEEFLGFSGRVAGESLGVVVRHPRLREILKGTLANGEERGQECEISGPPPRCLVVHTSGFDLGGNQRGMVAVLYDITERKRLEAIRRDFVASASHELRTPVTAIQGYAETLKDGALDDPAAARPFVENLHRQSLRLTALVEDLLSLSRLESGKWTVALGEVDLERLIQAARRQVEFAAQEKGIHLEVRLPVRRVVAEEAALEQVLVNLLDNAVKYSPAGSRVRVRSDQTPAGVALSVEDEGIGIPEEHQARIFERFYRVDPARSRALGGTGLGLAIVKHLVQNLGGRVEVESSPDKGSTFTIILPAPPA